MSKKETNDGDVVSVLATFAEADRIRLTSLAARHRIDIHEILDYLPSLRDWLDELDRCLIPDAARREKSDAIDAIIERYLWNRKVTE